MSLSPKLMVPVGLTAGSEEAGIGVDVGTGVRVGAAGWLVAPEVAAGAVVAWGAVVAAGALVGWGVAVADAPQAAIKSSNRTAEVSTIALENLGQP
jgi:carbonic anhydrase/acetyltransferase-like protein (isoleucine patch superfamily)